MYVIIRCANGDRLSRRYASRKEAIEDLRWLVADTRAHPHVYAVREIDAAGNPVGAPILIEQPAA